MNDEPSGEHDDETDDDFAEDPLGFLYLVHFPSGGEHEEARVGKGEGGDGGTEDDEVVRDIYDKRNCIIPTAVCVAGDEAGI